MTTMQTRGNIRPVAIGDITVRPDLFQFRDDAGGYDKTAVDRLVKSWDWNRYDPIAVVADPDAPCKYIVVGGHHRYEAMRRLESENPDQQAEAATVRIIEGDVKDPQQRQAIQNEALLSNYAVRGTSLLADADAVRRLSEQGQSPKQIADAMNENRVSKVNDLLAFSALHQGDRQFVQQVPDFYPIAVELGYAVRKGLPPDEASAILRHIRTTYDDDGKIPNRQFVKNLLQLQKVADEQGQQSTFNVGDTGSFNAIKRLAQENADMEREIRTLKTRLGQCEALSRESGVDVAELRGPVESRIAELEQALETRREALRGGWDVPKVPPPASLPDMPPRRRPRQEPASVPEPAPDPLTETEPAPFLQDGPDLFAGPSEAPPMPSEPTAGVPETPPSETELPPFVQDGPDLFAAPLEPPPMPPESAAGVPEAPPAAQNGEMSIGDETGAIQQTVLGDDFADNRTMPMAMGEPTGVKPPLIEAAPLEAAQERRDALERGQIEMPEAETAKIETAEMVARDRDTGEEVKITAVKDGDGQMAIAVESDDKPGPLFEAASEAAKEVAGQPDPKQPAETGDVSVTVIINDDDDTRITTGDTPVKTRQPRAKRPKAPSSEQKPPSVRQLNKELDLLGKQFESLRGVRGAKATAKRSELKEQGRNIAAAISRAQKAQVKNAGPKPQPKPQAACPTRPKTRPHRYVKLREGLKR